MDRNTALLNSVKSMSPSLSARRAWIEMIVKIKSSVAAVVALRKESVDRNYNAPHVIDTVCCRSPQGERG